MGTFVLLVCLGAPVRSRSAPGDNAAAVVA